MPLRIRWTSKEYIGVALMLLGACGIFQTIFIFVAIFALSIGNYLVVILVPIGVTIALYYGALIAFESFAQVERRAKLRTQYKKKSQKRPLLRSILDFPISKPLLVLFVLFTVFFLITYLVTNSFMDNIISFIITEFVSTLLCLLIANYLERAYAKISRY